MSESRHISADDLTGLNESFESQGATDIIQWAHATFGDRLAVLSSFQQAGCALCHLVHQLQLPLEIVMVDTGVLFPETYETIDKYQAMGLTISTLRPERSMEDQNREEGALYLTREGQERCCELRKVAPLRQIRGRYDAILSSLHRSAGGARSQVPVLTPDSELNLLRIHPLYNWPREQITTYIDSNNVIVNPLHAQGYPTIGCTRCTTPVLPGEPERAGRWRHLQGQESAYCRINPTDRGGSEVITVPTELYSKLLGKT